MATGCGDVVSLEDLKTAKLHQVFEAEVITGLSGGVPGGSNIDYATNLVTGQVQKTMPAILRDLGFSPASFDFTTGGTLSSNDRGKAVLWTIASGGDGDWYYWEGALPKVIPAASTPASTGGVADGAWRPVGDITLRSQFSNVNGATLYPSLHMSRWRDTGDARGFGIVGNGTTDDTAAINAAIASFGSTGGKLYFPKFANGAERNYLVNWANISNPSGVELTGPGAVVSAAAYGGFEQHNLYGNQFRISYGQEYLYRIYKRMELDQQAGIFLFGDSTMQSGNGESTGYGTGPLVEEMFLRSGLNVKITNRGVSGSSMYQMNAVPDISANSDLFIIKYGINDGFTPGTGDRFANFATAMRAKLAEIRSNAMGGKNDLSIILVGPNATNDSQHTRDAKWYEKLKGIYLQAARDYQCAYFDTYAYMPDVKNSANYSMDDPFGNGQSVHPLNTMQCWIWGGVIKTFFGYLETEKYRNNNFVNASSASGAPTNTATLLNFNRGWSAYRATVANGWLFEGTVVTFRSPDGIGFQELVSYVNLGSKIIRRTWNTSTNTWNAWSGIGAGLTPASGWVATGQPEARISTDGLVTISAKLTGGTTATGTSILTGLPAYMRPAAEKRFAQTNDNGTHTCVGVSATGNIFLVGTTTDATNGFHVNLSYYAVS